MSQIVIITAVGASDRPGIVAALTESVFSVGGNLDDATMTRLHGAFATMLSARIAGEQALAALRARLLEVAKRLDLTVTVNSIPDQHDEPAPDHLISVYGADKPGIVFEVTRLLANLDINITDLDTRVAGSSGNEIYVMLLETSGGDWTIVPQRLAEVAARVGVELSHREIETEAL